MGKRNVSSFVVYDDATKTLTLIKRSPEIRNIVKIANDKNYHISYKPLTLHVGAVTVGGVTTGGAYTTGGYNYVSGTSNSGYYQILFEGKTIEKIKMDDELFSITKKSEVAPYLDEKTKEIKVIKEVTYSQAEVERAISSLKSTGCVGNINKGYPDLEKAVKILAWMCDFEDEPDLVLDDKDSKIRPVIGIIISLGLLALPCATAMQLILGLLSWDNIALVSIIPGLLGGFILVRCTSTIVRRQKRKKKIRNRIKRSRK